MIYLRVKIAFLTAILLIAGLAGCKRQPAELRLTQEGSAASRLSTETASSGLSTSQAGRAAETPAYPGPGEPVSGQAQEPAPYPGPLEFTPGFSYEQTPYPEPDSGAAGLVPTLTPTSSRFTATATPTKGQSYASPSPTVTATPEGPYPPPGNPGLYTGGTPYPGPVPNTGTGPYPGIEPTKQLLPTITSSPTLLATQTKTSTPVPTAIKTPGVTPTDTLTTQPIPGTWTPRPVPPPASGETGVVRLWHAWNESQSLALEQIIQAFQENHPDVRFDVQRVHFDDLLSSYETALYRGTAPTLLFGPSDWGSVLYDNGMVADLSNLISSSVQASIVPAARDTGKYRGAQVSLPYAMQGIVMYRNQRIMPSAPATFEELIQFSRQATRGGVVGTFFDLGAYFTMGNLQGLGGRWLDDYGTPQFNALDYRYGLEWMDLLVSLSDAGAVETNGNRDVNLFKQGKVGLIVDGSWNREVLAQAIGRQNLKIDPWPEFLDGHLAGFVQGESLYLNPALRSPEDLRAVTGFIKFLLQPENQARLAEAGFIPCVKGTQPEDPLIQQALQALESGTAFPPAMQGQVRTAYWDTLQVAMQDVLDRNVAPMKALQKAYQDILTRLREIKNLSEK